MKQEDELVLKVTKEIAIKFIEIGRLSVNSFDEVFKQIHETVFESLQERMLSSELKISKEDFKNRTDT